VNNKTTTGGIIIIVAQLVAGFLPRYFEPEMIHMIGSILTALGAGILGVSAADKDSY